MADVNLKLTIALSMCHNLQVQKVEKNLKKYELSLSEFSVLDMLFHKGPQAVQKVAEQILVTSGTITYIINKLQEKGLVERRKCEKDKRVFYVSLTEKGSTLIQEIMQEHKLFIDSVFQNIDDETKEQTVKNLFHLYKMMNQ